jgi:putative hydrolase of the HAD superfamily
MLRRPDIKAVTFDVGGTLIAPHPSIGAVYSPGGGAARTPWTLARRPRTPFPRGLARRRVVPPCPRRLGTHVDEVFEDSSGAAEHHVLPRSLRAEFGRAGLADLRRCHPDARSPRRLGLDLGVISNWDERLRPLLRDLRLDRYFNCVVVSCEAGFAKPSPSSSTRHSPSRTPGPAAVLHVGDARTISREPPPPACPPCTCGVIQRLPSSGPVLRDVVTALDAG